MFEILEIIFIILKLKWRNKTNFINVNKLLYESFVLIHNTKVTVDESIVRIPEM